jgi:NIMA-interacting peptidyl-prolyl cis-trans isomerase 1
MSETVDNITGLPDGWVVKFSKSKSQPYYYNINTLQSQWEPPHNANQDILKKYMAENYTATGPLTSSFEGEGNQAGKIRCAHLLVKHNKSRRASSWKQAEITRSEEDARAIIEGFEKRIRANELSLADLAVSESDCSSARKRGDLYAPSSTFLPDYLPERDNRQC